MSRPPTGLPPRESCVMVRLTATEAAQLDRERGDVPRAEWLRTERAAIAAWLRATGREMDARAVERGAHRSGEAG